MRQQILIGAAGAVCAAIALTILTALWNWLSGDGFAETLQGLFAQELVLPAGAIVAFAHQKGCPSGWERFEEGSGRFIVGVGKDEFGNEYKLPFIEEKPSYNTGGRPNSVISYEQLPSHSHNITDNQHTHTALAAYFDDKGSASQGYPNEHMHKRFRTTDRDWKDNVYVPIDKSALQMSPSGITLASAGNSKPIDTRPPYIALYFCKKNPA